jgi:hypothetical protein
MSDYLSGDLPLKVVRTFVGCEGSELGFELVKHPQLATSEDVDYIATPHQIAESRSREERTGRMAVTA